MTGAMYAAIAGLRTHMQNLNVIGNNVANVNTYSYKSGRAIFKTSLYTTLSGGSNGTTVSGGKNPSQIGYGSTVGSVDIDMSTGNYGVTGKPTDLMLDGDGFFLLGDKSQTLNFDGKDPNELKSLTLTRLGNFEFKADGYLTNEAGMVVYGFACIGTYQEGDKIPEGKKVGDPIFSDQLVPIRYPRVYSDKDGGLHIGYPKPGGGTNEDDRLNDAAGGGQQPGDPDAATNQHLYDYGTTLKDNGETVESTYEVAKFTNISFSETTGLITGTSEATGEVVTIGCVAVGMVTNPNGVTQVGSTNYKAGEGAGDLSVAILGGGAQSMGITQVNKSLIPADGNAGGNAGGAPDAADATIVDGLRIRTSGTLMRSSGLEMSKTDLAQEIANMIVTQRGYQANTRIITVTDSMLEELVNMKR